MKNKSAKAASARTDNVAGGDTIFRGGYELS
jgi:hypothetical protein